MSNDTKVVIPLWGEVAIQVLLQLVTALSTWATSNDPTIAALTTSVAGVLFNATTSYLHKSGATKVASKNDTSNK
ncbi:MAG: hypothetical protein HXX08_11445 [Chloroflexi bacterium]|uniref:Holin n=1 Tax=Candidatus Chlorohelix allophototropha TaxID=3003348 RepID=A0A8T7LWZ7_9CHLR|nr:hypothetical protein [Chloroflexota bacterium]WJW65852.1 hypothetical protein OZ401_001631 [Chloroflexota bacterium L227-S17]